MSVTLRALACALLAGCFSAGAAAAPAAAPHFRLAVWPQNMPSPDFALLDTDNKSRTLRDWRGRIALVFFGFVQCPDACPTELLKLARVMKQLGPLSDQVQVLFVTLDPKHDTPQQLKRYLAAFDPRFVGLRGSVAQIDATAKRFAVNYAPIARGAGSSIDHSTATFVMDTTGALRLVGAPASSVADFVHDIKALAAQ